MTRFTIQRRTVTARDETGYRLLAPRSHKFKLTDPLTGLPNRRAFDERMLVPGNGMLLLIDIETCGDETVQAVARVIASSVDLNDYVARVARERFAVVAPTVTPDSGHGISERIRAAVGRATGLGVSVEIRQTGG